MKKFEYKTLVLPFRIGIFKQGVPDIKAALDAEGGGGWQFKQMILPSSQWGTSDSMVAILERTVEYIYASVHPLAIYRTAAQSCGYPSALMPLCTTQTIHKALVGF